MNDKTKASVIGIIAIAGYTLVIEPSLHALHLEEPQNEKPALISLLFVFPPHEHTHEENHIPSPVYQNLIVTDVTSSSSLSVSSRVGWAPPTISI